MRQKLHLQEIESSKNQSSQMVDTNGVGDTTIAAEHHEDFNEEAEDNENIKTLFESIAYNCDRIDLACFTKARKDLKFSCLDSNSNVYDDWDRVADTIEAHLTHKSGSKGIDLCSFQQIIGFEVPKSPGRVHWAGSINLGSILAKFLKPGNIFDGQRGIKEMNEPEIIAACAEFTKHVPRVVLGAWRNLREGKALNPEDANSKFAMTEGAFAGRFATLDDFYRGVEYKLGQPNPKLDEGMHKEHCARPNAGTWFIAPNYGLCTKPRWEWHWTTAADDESPFADLRERLAAQDGCYPGEVGDRYCQIAVRFEVDLGPPSEPWAAAVATAPAAVAEQLNSGLKAGLGGGDSGLLDTAEGRLRGVAVVDPAKITGVMETAVAMTVALPMPQAAFTADKADLLRGAVGQACGVPAARISVDRVTERTWIYSRFTSDARLRAALDRTPLAELPALVLSVGAELGLDEEQLAACGAAARSALRAAPSARLTVQELCEGYDGEALGAREAARLLADGWARQSREWGERGWRRKQGRTRDGTVLALMERPCVAPTVARARLQRAEFTALRLYTGPLYTLYNALMRDFPPDIVEGLAGNRFETTMFAIVSGITKLAKVTPVPPRRLLYRGLGGMLLPEQFWRKTAQGFLGGVELGLMSTTSDRAVAVQYSGHEQRRPTMLEIQAGRIDVGASLGFLSQYAGEEEFLMQPLSCLEVTGRPRVDRTAQGEVLVVPIRVNVNLRSVTVEELTERRKVLHLAMAKNLREELSYEAADGAERFLERALRRARGAAEAVAGGAEVDADEWTVRCAETAAAGFPYAPRSAGLAYYEVEILSFDTRGMVVVGVAGSNFRSPSMERNMPPLGLDDASWGVYSYTDNQELVSFRLHGFDPELEVMPSAWGRELREGEVVGVAYDLVRGTLSVSVGGSFAPPMGEAFEQGVRPGLVAGAGIFPVFGGQGVILQYNAGTDPVGRPFRFAPPSPGYLERAAVEAAGSVTTTADLARLGLDAAQLVERFQGAYDTHAGLDAADFNDDLRYKELVNEALDLKVRLLNRQRAVIALCDEGAGEEQLRLCADAPCADFAGGALEAECAYRWRDVFAGYFVHKPLVEVPLGLAPAQAALVWGAALAAGGAVAEVKLGAEVLPMAALGGERLCVVAARLQYAKYGAAVAGLAMANRALTDMDLRGHEYAPDAADRLVEAVAGLDAVAVINGCRLEDGRGAAEPADLRRAIAAGCSLSVGQFLDVSFGAGADLAACLFSLSKSGKKVKSAGMSLNRVTWAFVLARVQALEWRALDLRVLPLGEAGCAALAACAAQLTTLQSLDLRGCNLGSSGGAAVAGQLISLTALRSLDLRDNRLGAEGWDAAWGSISRLSEGCRAAFVGEEACSPPMAGTGPRADSLGFGHGD